MRFSVVNISSSERRERLDWEATVIVPVRSSLTGKSRIRAVLAGDTHAENALSAFIEAMTIATVAALTAVPRVTTVALVTRDVTLAAGAAAAGARVIWEPDCAAPDINRAIVHAVEKVKRGDAIRLAAIVGDLPYLRPDDVTVFLNRDPGASHFLQDLSGMGTTAIAGAVGGGLIPLFGPDSALLHRAAGAEPADGHESLRCDVDTISDLLALDPTRVAPLIAPALAALRSCIAVSEHRIAHDTE